MAKMTFNQRAERSLKLLLGMRLRKVRKLLEPYGFTDETPAEGWRYMALLVQPTGNTGESMRLRYEADNRLQELVDTWMPVARAVLRARFGEKGCRGLEGVRSQKAHSKVVAAELMLRLIDDMKKEGPPFGQEGPAVRELLSKHGLDSATEEEIRATLAEVWSPKGAASVCTSPEDDDEQAIEELWAWYLKWSEIARVAIKNKTLLRALGFSPRRSKAAAIKESPSSGRVVRGASAAQ